MLRRLLAAFFSLVITGALLAPGANVAHAQEGGPVNVGYLADENFNYLDTNTQDPNHTNKLSGWIVDSLAGTYDYSYCDEFWVNDTSTANGISMMKQFVKQTAGRIALEFRIKMPAILEYPLWQLRSGTTSAVGLETHNNALWYINSSHGLTQLQSINPNQYYGIKVVADIDTDTMDIYVDGILKAGGAPFENAVSSLDNFNFFSGSAATGYIFMKPVKIYKGYNVHERLITTAAGNVPSDWTANATGGTVSAQEMMSTGSFDRNSFKLADTSSGGNVALNKSFAPVTGKYVYEYKVLVPAAVDGMSAELCSGSTTAMKLLTSGGNLCYVNASGTNTVLQPYQPNVWYSIKMVADTASDTADIYINSKLKQAGAALSNPVGSFDGIKFYTNAGATGVMWVDDILLYPFQNLPADYVSVPTPVSSPNQILGMQSFAGWRNGHHGGWDYPARFPNRNLAMGTYDQGNPEASDWQLKWMAEHGVDYFMDCWFEPSNYSGAPIKDPLMGYEIHDGYFNAQYSNYVKFAIAATSIPASSAVFRNYYVPFWMEYYFKDPRYMTIDNKPVIGIMDLNAWKTKLGSTAAVKAEMDYLRTQLVNAGFAGAYILVNTATATTADLNEFYNMGADYSYSYTYYSSSIYWMQTVMNNQKNAGSSLGILPTVSSGWYKDAWDMTPDGDDGFVSASDFQTLCSWVKNTFMPSLPAGSLGRQMVMIDNWNEYGEGHYINPSALNGFGYLDALRTVFTSNPAHTDAWPSETQRLRINALYSKGWTGHSWNFDGGYSDTEGWGSFFNVGTVTALKGYMTIPIVGSDSQMVSRDNLNISIASRKYVKIKMKNSTAGTQGRVYFTTAANTAWDESKAKSFTLTANDSNNTEYVIDMSTVTGWTGTLKQLRIDPVQTGASSGTVTIDYITVTD